MTTEELSDLITRERIREKLVNRAVKDFPKDASRAEDWAQRTILSGLRKAPEFNDETGAMAYLMEKVVFIALEERERELERRNLLRGIPKFKTSHDPMRHIDYKVDLERGIKTVVGHPTLRKAMWHIHYEKWTWEEVLESMPKDVPEDTWRSRLKAATRDVRKEMRRKGYRRG